MKIIRQSWCSYWNFHNNVYSMHRLYPDWQTGYFLYSSPTGYGYLTWICLFYLSIYFFYFWKFNSELDDLTAMRLRNNLPISLSVMGVLLKHHKPKKTKTKKKNIGLNSKSQLSRVFWKLQIKVRAGLQTSKFVSLHAVGYMGLGVKDSFFLIERDSCCSKRVLVISPNYGVYFSTFEFMEIRLNKHRVCCRIRSAHR